MEGIVYGRIQIENYEINRDTTIEMLKLNNYNIDIVNEIDYQIVTFLDLQKSGQDIINIKLLFKDNKLCEMYILKNNNDIYDQYWPSVVNDKAIWLQNSLDEYPGIWNSIGCLWGIGVSFTSEEYNKWAKYYIYLK